MTRLKQLKFSTLHDFPVDWDGVQEYGTPTLLLSGCQVYHVSWYTTRGQAVPISFLSFTPYFYSYVVRWHTIWPWTDCPTMVGQCDLTLVPNVRLSDLGRLDCLTMVRQSDCTWVLKCLGFRDRYLLIVKEWRKGVPCSEPYYILHGDSSWVKINTWRRYYFEYFRIIVHKWHSIKCVVMFFVKWYIY